MREHPSIIKRYPSYKESGIPWLGEIPEHWVKLRLKNICEINKDSLREDSNNLIFDYISISDINNSGLIINKERLSFSESPSRARRLVKHRDIIVSTVRTYLEAIAYIDECSFLTVASTGFAVLSPIQNIIYSKYLFYRVKCQSSIDWIVAHSLGISYPAITAFSLGALPIALPPLTEQRAIADYLDGETARIDSIVERLTAQRTRYEQLKRSLISEVITKGLPHHDPATFRSLRLKDTGEITSAGVDKKINPNEQEVYMLNYLDVYKSKTYAIDSTDGFMVVTANENQIADKNVLRGDVFFTPSSETIEDIGVSIVILNDLLNTVYSYHIVRFRPFHFMKLLNIEYCKYLFNNESVQYYMSQNSKGTTRKILNMNVIENLPIALPTLTEQKEIVDYLDERCGRIDRIVEAIGRKIELLEALRKSIIEEVVTGKRAVS